MASAFQYQWNNYLKSGGSERVKLFQDIMDGVPQRFMEFNDTIKELHSKFCPSKAMVNECYDDINTIIHALERGIWDVYACLEPDVTYDTHSGLKCVENSFREANNDIKFNDEDLIELFCEGMARESLAISLQSPDLFFPYFFRGNHNVVEYIAREFDIELPPMPPKKDYLGRFYYYADLCDAFQNFRFENGLSAAELWAFLYDYAPNCVGLMDYISDELPEPRSAFLIGSKLNDIYINEDITLWQCNPDTRAGDMIVMYITYPECRIGKVWRSISAGFDDPFFFYYRCTYIGRCKNIKGMTLKQMKSDKIVGKLPIVNKNMQGVNGTEIKPSIYNYMIDKAHSKIIKISCYEANSSIKIQNEHDVEIQLIEPLLEKLGWSKSEYVPQMNIRLGSGADRIVPDYVILPEQIPYHETALYVIEAKQSITSEKKLDAAKGQARSYARQLQSKNAVIASQEGIWVTSEDDDFNDIVFHCTWEEMNDPDIFSQLSRFIGKK